MKLPGKKKQKKNTNKRIIGRLIIIMLLVSAGVLSTFYLVESQDLRFRSESSIRRYVQDQANYFEDRSYIAVYELYMADDTDFYIDEIEKNLTYYYREHKDRLENGKFYWYAKGDTAAFFMPLNASKRDSYMPEGAQSLVLYADMGYYFGLLRDNTLIMAVVLAVVCIMMFLASRYTIRRLDAKDADMKNFFANASHELKTPLMAIRGNVDGIRNGYVQTRDGCEVIEKETERMSGLISSILDLSKVDSGVVEPDMTDNDVREILYDAASSVQMEAKNRGIRLEMDLPEPIFRMCDENMLYSAFSNILTNAVRYADSMIRVRSGKAGQDQVLISFENDGVPISREDMVHVFDRFFKGPKGQNGLGMALAQEYMRMHGSEITVRVQDEITVFEMIL